MKLVMSLVLIGVFACARPPNWMREPPEEKLFLVKRVDAKTWSAVDHGYYIQVLPGCGPRDFDKVYKARITPLWYLTFFEHKKTGDTTGVVRISATCPMTMMYPKPEPLGISWDLAR